ncbi:hypothetical protein SISNIDRAFT_551987 [Sistotremastrum niveocremeum HHB9708]|nr:hypothetical protein SISNIDRAFT_551987 [Sistotremastrum niveocremeum HHB9708]
MSSAGLSQVTLQLQNRITSLERLLRAAENARPGAAPKAAAASDKGPTRTHVVLDSEDEIMDDPEADQVEQNSSGSMQEDAEDPEPATKRLRRFSDTELKRIRVYAKKFTVMGMIWLRDPADTFALGSDSDYDPVHRFDSEETALQGQYQDLAELVSKNFHDFFDEYQFQKVFNKAMQNHRSHLANMLRRKSGSAIFLVRQQELRCSTSREQFKRLVGWDKKARTKGNKKVAGYHTWAPILYLNENPAEGPYAVFRHPTLIAIAQAMLWGPAAIYVDLKDVVFYGTVSGRQWGVRRTTPGLIAGAAIWARWIISVDPTFNPVGPISNIPYQEDFDCYLKYLLKGLAENKNAVINLFKTWDKEVFDAKGLQEDPSRGIDSYEQQLYEQLENDGEPIEIDGEEDETEEEEEEEEEENEAEGGQEDRQGVEHDEEAAEGAVDADLNFNGSGYEGPGYDDNGEIQEADPTHQVEE